MWSMYKTEYLDPEHELVIKYPKAVSHDGSNTVFVEAPSDLNGCYIVPGSFGMETPEEKLAALIMDVGNFLVNQTEQPLVASKDQLETLFHTPHHRLWCAAYESESDQSFLDDKTSVGLDPLLTMAEAKAAIKTLVS